MKKEFVTSPGVISVEFLRQYDSREVERLLSDRNDLLEACKLARRAIDQLLGLQKTLAGTMNEITSDKVFKTTADLKLPPFPQDVLDSIDKAMEKARAI